jgi:hypothetical protein
VSLVRTGMCDAILYRGSTWGSTSMRLPRFVRGLGLTLVLGLGVPGFGCGSGARRPSTEDLAAQKAIRAEIRQAQKKQTQRAAGAPRGGTPGRGASRAKPGS